MKKALIITFILFSIVSFSQNIPKIEFKNETEEINRYFELLKLKDKNALIIKIGYSSYWSKGVNGNYVVYLNNGKVKKYSVYEPTDLKMKNKIKRKRIKRKEYKFYWNFLNEIIENNKYKIDQSRLNITSKKGKEDGTMETMVISDGADYILGFFQNKKFTTYYSYMPKSFIQDKYPGFEERQKLVDLIEGIENLIKNTNGNNV